MWISSWVQVEVVRFNWRPEAIWSHHFPQGVQSPSAGPLRGSDQSFCRDSEGQDQAEPKQFALGKNHWLSSTWHVPWSNLTMAPWKKPPSFKTWLCLSRICSYILTAGIFMDFSHCHVQKRGTVTRFFWTPVDSYEVILIKAPSDFEYAHWGD